MNTKRPEVTAFADDGVDSYGLNLVPQRRIANHCYFLLPESPSMGIGP